MSEDIGERLIRRIENSDTVAMHEIERTLRQLRAELAAANETLELWDKLSAFIVDTEYTRRVRAHIDAARAARRLS